MQKQESIKESKINNGKQYLLIKGTYRSSAMMRMTQKTIYGGYNLYALSKSSIKHKQAYFQSVCITSQSHIGNINKPILPLIYKIRKIEVAQTI